MSIQSGAHVMRKSDPIAVQLADARKNQILDAATQVFADRGFHAATIKDIAQQAGVADGTIYLYFKTKADLFVGILDRLNETERRAVDLSAAVPTEADFREFFATYMRKRLSLLEENLRTFQAVIPELLQNRELRERYLTEILEPSFRIAVPLIGKRLQPALKRKVSVELAVRTIPSMVLGMLILRMLGDPTVEKSWAELPDLLTTMLFDGFWSQSQRGKKK
ncbi:MAG: TetR/AcrR family transcriptional regulator [Myxococcales bacterium]|nr:TetR/AcrR family transcriptional regulator [Myxococcales bacterium]